ncbi:MAG: DUF5663 domain-containing protein [bacterium]
MEYTISNFVDRLLLEKGVTGLSAEVMTQLKSDLEDRAEEMVNAELLAHMPEDHLEEFEKVIDGGDEEKIQAFCREKIENLDEVVAGALVRLQKMYLENTL